ncbi:MAG: hypothetical protein DGJ47_000712 [Rickettsiaceae bacterium]
MPNILKNILSSCLNLKYLNLHQNQGDYLWFSKVLEGLSDNKVIEEICLDNNCIGIGFDGKGKTFEPLFDKKYLKKIDLNVNIIEPLGKLDNLIKLAPKLSSVSLNNTAVSDQNLYYLIEASLIKENFEHLSINCQAQTPDPNLIDLIKNKGKLPLSDYAIKGILDNLKSTDFVKKILINQINYTQCSNQGLKVESLSDFELEIEFLNNPGKYESIELKSGAKILFEERLTLLKPPKKALSIMSEIVSAEEEDMNLVNAISSLDSQSNMSGEESYSCGIECPLM